MNIFGKVRIAHKSLGSLGISYRGLTPRFHTLRSMQGIEPELDEHKRITIMFQ
jgi:hypothetical protein